MTVNTGLLMNLAVATRSRRQRGELLSFAVIGVVIVALDWSIALWLHWSCPLRSATTLFCPGCGATHAVTAVLHGELWLACRSNALVTVLPLAAIAISLSPESVRRYFRGDGTARFLFLTLVVFTILRNLPGFAVLKAT